MSEPVEAKQKAISLAITQIEKQFGKGSIMRLGEGVSPQGIASISTGSLGLDIALGVGGIPRGRVIEIYGPESSGKTTLALSIVAEPRKKAARLPLSMPSMLWMWLMPGILG